MARGDEVNTATTSFFILVGRGTHLDGKFAAFGRVTKGMEVADAINKAPVSEEKPDKPVRIKKDGGQAVHARLVRKIQIQRHSVLVRH